MRYHFIQQQLQEQKPQEQKHLKKERGVKQAGIDRPVGIDGPSEKRPGKARTSLSTWCRVLEVSHSGYHAFTRRKVSLRQRETERLLVQIQAIHERSRQSYGSPRVHVDLLAQGYRCGVNRVARLMKQHHISAKVKRRHVVTTDSRHGLPVAANVLSQEFEAPEKDKRWVCDITYLWTEEGWLYLAPILDLFSRRVVGWSLKENMERALVIDALQAALRGRRPGPGLLCHSDRGSQYASLDYQQQLRAAGIVCSMSRKGNCYDNAVMESFFATLKKELIHRSHFKTREEARLKIFEWIEVWYNRERRHSAIGYLSPARFEAQQSGAKQPHQNSRIAA